MEKQVQENEEQLNLPPTCNGVAKPEDKLEPGAWICDGNPLQWVWVPAV